MTLREQITSDVSEVFLNVEEFAEALVYLPLGGEERTILGVVDEDGDFPDTDFGRNEAEVVEVFVNRDSTTGIDSPQHGDALYRVIDGEGDAAKWYSYSGQKGEADENAWTLRFIRTVPSKHGGLPRV